MSNYFPNYNNAYEDYLCHHGVKGMKWGIRKVRPYDKVLNNFLHSRYKHHDYAVNKEPSYKNLKEAYKYAKKTAKYKNKLVSMDRKEDKKAVKEEFEAKAKSIRDNMSRGRKISNALVYGPLANKTYSYMIANGASEKTARAKMKIAGTLGGTPAHLAISNSIKRKAVNTKFDDVYGPWYDYLNEQKVYFNNKAAEAKNNMIDAKKKKKP